MEEEFNNSPRQQNQYSRNPNFRKQVENYEKNKMHSLAISVMNLISLFNSSSNGNNINISSMNVLSKIKSINEINKDEINDEINYGMYLDQIGGNLDKGGVSQSMLSNNNNYPGRPILEKYNFYYKQLKGENPLEETAFHNPRYNNNNEGNHNNGSGFIENFDDKNNPLRGILRGKYNNDDEKKSDHFINTSDNKGNRSTIIQFNDYIIRNNNPGKYSEKKYIDNL